MTILVTKIGDYSYKIEFRRTNAKPEDIPLYVVMTTNIWDVPRCTKEGIEKCLSVYGENLL